MYRVCHLWGVPGCECQSSVGSSNQLQTQTNYRVCSICGVLQLKLQLKHICGVYQGVPIICGVLQSKLQAQKSSNLFILFLNCKLSIYRSIYKSNHSFPTILYKTESWHQKYALKLWLWLVLLLSGSSLLVKDGDKQNFKVHITSLLHVASSKSRDEVFLQVAF